MICVRVMSVCVSASLHEALLFAPFVGFFLSHLNRKADLEFGCETGKRHEGRRVSVCFHSCVLPQSVKGEIRGETHTVSLTLSFPPFLSHTFLFLSLLDSTVF